MNSRFIEIDDTEIEISQDSSFGYAGEVWDAALVLTQFLINKSNKHKFSLKDKIILELGSGTGICGLIAAKLGAKKVYLTDKEDNLPMLKRNYELNKDNLNTNTEVSIVSVDWTKKEQYKNVTDIPDVIICSDIVWNPVYYNDLMETIEYFSATLITEVLICYQYREKKEIEFFNNFKENYQWKIESISDSLLDDEYKSDDIFIIIMKK